MTMVMAALRRAQRFADAPDTVERGRIYWWGRPAIQSMLRFTEGWRVEALELALTPCPLALHTLGFRFDFGNLERPFLFLARPIYGADETQALMPQEGTRPLSVELADCLEGDGLLLRNNAYRQLFGTGNPLCSRIIDTYFLADLHI